MTKIPMKIKILSNKNKYNWSCSIFVYTKMTLVDFSWCTNLPWSISVDVQIDPGQISYIVNWS